MVQRVDEGVEKQDPHRDAVCSHLIEAEEMKIPFSPKSLKKKSNS